MADHDYNRMSLAEVEALAEAGDPGAQQALAGLAADLAPAVARVIEATQGVRAQFATIAAPPSDPEPIWPQPARITMPDYDFDGIASQVRARERWNRAGVIAGVVCAFVALGSLAFTVWG